MWVVEAIRFSEHYYLVVALVLVLVPCLVLRRSCYPTLISHLTWAFGYISSHVLPIVLLRRWYFSFWELACHSAWWKVWSVWHVLEALVGFISGIRIFQTSWVSDATLLIGLLNRRLWYCLAVGDLNLVSILAVVLSTDNLWVILSLGTALRWASLVSASLGKWRSVP